MYAEGLEGEFGEVCGGEDGESGGVFKVMVKLSFSSSSVMDKVMKDNKL